MAKLFRGKNPAASRPRLVDVVAIALGELDDGRTRTMRLCAVGEDGVSTWIDLSADEAFTLAGEMRRLAYREAP